MRRFDCSFLGSGSIPAHLINPLTSIYSLKTADENRKNSFKSVYVELEKRARFQSVKSSNAIEGIVTTDERIHAIVNQNSVPLNQTEEEIAGYRDALNVVHSSYQSLSVNEDTLLNLHRILLQRAKPDAKGHYKTEDNVIMEVRSDGTRSVCFRPVPVKETKNAME